MSISFSFQFILANIINSDRENQVKQSSTKHMKLYCVFGQIKKSFSLDLSHCFLLVRSNEKESIEMVGKIRKISIVDWLIGNSLAKTNNVAIHVEHSLEIVSFKSLKLVFWFHFNEFDCLQHRKSCYGFFHFSCLQTNHESPKSEGKLWEKKNTNFTSRTWRQCKLI